MISFSDLDHYQTLSALINFLGTTEGSAYLHHQEGNKRLFVHYLMSRDLSDRSQWEVLNRLVKSTVTTFFAETSAILSMALQDEELATPLHLAAQKDNASAIQFLHYFCAQNNISWEPNITDGKACTALGIARLWCSTHASEALLRLPGKTQAEVKLNIDDSLEAHGITFPAGFFRIHEEHRPTSIALFLARLSAQIPANHQVFRVRWQSFFEASKNLSGFFEQEELGHIFDECGKEFTLAFVSSYLDSKGNPHVLVDSKDEEDLVPLILHPKILRNHEARMLVLKHLTELNYKLPETQRPLLRSAYREIIHRVIEVTPMDAESQKKCCEFIRACLAKNPSLLLARNLASGETFLSAAHGRGLDAISMLFIARYRRLPEKEKTVSINRYIEKNFPGLLRHDAPTTQTPSLPRIEISSAEQSVATQSATAVLLSAMQSARPPAGSKPGLIFAPAPPIPTKKRGHEGTTSQPQQNQAVRPHFNPDQPSPSGTHSLQPR